MASSMMVSSTVSATISRAAPAHASMVAPFTGLKSSATFPITPKQSNNLSTLPRNGGRVQCTVIVTAPALRKKFETLSYQSPLSPQQLGKEVDYLLRQGWTPCLEFDNIGSVPGKKHASPGYYDGRNRTTWKLPTFGCTDSSQVLKEVEEAKKAYPNYYIRIIGFDHHRQVQRISFNAYKPPGS